MDKLGEALLIIKGEAPTHPSYRDVFLMNVGLVEKEIQRLRLDIITAHGELQVLLDERDSLRAELEALKAAHQWQPIETAPICEPIEITAESYLSDREIYQTTLQDELHKSIVCRRFAYWRKWMPLPPTDTAESSEGVSNA